MKNKEIEFWGKSRCVRFNLDQKSQVFTLGLGFHQPEKTVPPPKLYPQKELGRSVAACGNQSRPKQIQQLA